MSAVESLAMAAELGLSAACERRLGPLAAALEKGRPGLLLRAAKLGARAGLAVRLARRVGGSRLREPRLEHLASVLYIISGVGFRFAWVGAGHTSGTDDEAVARAAREPASRLGAAG